jgi:outer membrane protein assembly factor BamB
MAPVVDLKSGTDALFVLDGEGLARFDTAAGEERWSRTDVARVACSEPALVVVDEHGLGWLSPRGELLAHVALAIGRHRAIACLANGAVLVADDAGSLVWLETSGIKARGKLPEGRLVSLDPTSDGLLVAAYRDGRVIALRPPD